MEHTSHFVITKDLKTGFWSVDMDTTMAKFQEGTVFSTPDNPDEDGVWQDAWEISPEINKLEEQMIAELNAFCDLMNQR